MEMREIDLRTGTLPALFRVGAVVVPSLVGSRVLELGLTLATGEPVVVDRTNQRAYVGSWNELVAHAARHTDFTAQMDGGVTCH